MTINNPTPTVVFIGGAGRSGTTLLDCLLGQQQGIFSAGELAHIWERGVLGNQLCGCGEPFLDCPFWRAVLEDGFNSANYMELKRLRRAVQRIRYIPYYYLNREPNNRYISVYRESLTTLYRAIGRVSGARIIVDSSKEPSHGFLLASTPEIDMKLIHLLRDSRAVAFSWMRQRVRPEVHWKVQYMPQPSLVKSALLWNYYNMLTGLLCRKVQDCRVVRYEELVSSPSIYMDMLLSWLGCQEGSSVPIESDGVVEITANHSVAGNPSRFDTGRIQIRSDNEWRSSMSGRKRMTVMALTFPLLANYYWRKGR